MFSPSKAKSRRPSPINCRRSFRRTKKRRSNKPPTTDLAAFDLYSRAKTLLLSTSFLAVIVSKICGRRLSFLTRQSQRDPSFFEAYCQLALCSRLALFSGLRSYAGPARLWPKPPFKRAIRAAARCRRNASGTGALSLLRPPRLRWRAGRTGNRAASLPNDPRIFELTGYILRRRGQQEEGSAQSGAGTRTRSAQLLHLQQIALSYQFCAAIQRSRHSGSRVDHYSERCCH